jgi:hypothetical protein
MTSKHYQAMAEIIRKSLSRINPDKSGEMVKLAHQEIAEELADFLAEDNESFDRARFLTACGLAE